MSGVIFDKLTSASTGKSVNVEDIIDAIRIRVIDVGTGLPIALEDKVNKVEDHSLVADSEILRLLDIESEATKNSTDEELRERSSHTGEQPIATITGLGPILLGKVDKIDGHGLVDDADITKLTTVETGATKNESDAQLRDRATHTGLQSTDTIDGLDDILSNKVNAEIGKSLTPTSEIDKLLTVQPRATENQTDEHLLSRANHTGTQALSTVDGLVEALETITMGGSLGNSATLDVGTGPDTVAAGDDPRIVNAAQRSELTGAVSALSAGKVDKVPGKDLSDNNFTSEHRIKLEMLEGHKFKGTYISFEELQLNVPDAEPGAYADVDGGLETDVARYIWDSTDNLWVVQGSAASLTAGQVKTLLEENPNTNVLTNGEKAKLASVANGATVNRNDILNADKVHSHIMDEVDGLGGALENLGTTLESKVDKEAGKGLSDVNFTQIEKDKLSSLESSKFVGLFLSEDALPTSGGDGDYANVDGGDGGDVYRVIWDSSNSKWVKMQGVSTELTHTQIKQDYESNPDTNAFTDDEKAKLDTISNFATANRDDSENADAYHSHSIYDVIGLENLDTTLENLDIALESKVDKEDGKGLSETNFTQAEKDKLSSLEGSKFVGLFMNEGTLPLFGSDGDYANVDGDDGGDAYRVIWDSSNSKWVKMQGVSTELTPSQIKQGYESNPNTNAFTDVEKSKLAGVDSEATKNRDDSENADKVHSHTIGEVTGLDSALGDKVDKQDGKGLSDANFTQAEKDKLSSLEGSKFVGLFISESALPATGSDGDYANVDGGTGSDVYRVIWDSSDNKWVKMQGVSTELTPSQIKQQYESNPDTNAFTDDEKIKLTSVATLDEEGKVPATQLALKTINGQSVLGNGDIDLKGLSTISNPKLGVETLTEFRHPVSGKPLYTKTIDFGSLPNTTAKIVAHGAVNAEDVLFNNSMSYVKDSGTSRYPISFANPSSLVSSWYPRLDRTNVSITTGTDRTELTAIVTILYTKTTDTVASPVRLIGGGEQWIINASGPFFVKPVRGRPLLVKVSPVSVKIPSGLSATVAGEDVVLVAGITLSLTSNLVGSTAVAGTDYFVYLKSDATAYISASDTEADGRLIGGFHYGLTDHTEAPSGNKTEADMVKLRGINAHTFWDLTWRANKHTNRGLTFDGINWIDIYLADEHYAVRGWSKAGGWIAGGIISNGRKFPVIPEMFGGNGSATYGKLTPFVAWDMLSAAGMEPISYKNFTHAMYGVEEGVTSAGIATVIGKVEHYPRLTSRYGVEQATGVQWIWGADLGTALSDTWQEIADSRGQVNSGVNVSLYGASRAESVGRSGSRASAWDNGLTNSRWNIGVRGLRDHLTLD